MPRSPRHSRPVKTVGLFALATALALPFGLLGTGAAVAAAVPVPGPTLLNSATTTAVASAVNVRAQTGEWALASGSIDPTRNRLYVAVASPDPQLAQVDLITGTATLIPLGADGDYAAIDTAVSPLDGTVYVAHNSYLQGISVLDPSQSYAGASLPPVITAGLEDNPQALEVGNDGRVYALHSYQGIISVIGASTGPDRLNVVQALTGLGSRDGRMAIDNARDRLYVVSPESNTLTVIDTKAVPAAVLGVIPLAAPVGVGVNAETGEVLVTSIATNSVSWVTIAADQQSASVTRTESLVALPAGAEATSQPLSINVRADGTTFVVTHVYPSNKIHSQVTVIPPVVSAATPISSVTVGYGANDGILDPRAGGTLYVPNGSQGTVSEIADVTLSTYATSTSIGSTGTLRATLTRSDARLLAGTVNFTDASAQPLGTATVDNSGTAEIPVSSLPLGTFDFTAAVTAPSAITLSAAGTLTVGKAPSSITLTTTDVVEGTSATATVDVTGLPGIAATGAFTVTTAAGDALASGTVTNGRGSVTFSAPPAGKTALVAHFAGDGALLPSVSAAVELVVSARTPELTAPSTHGSVGDTSSVSFSGFAPGENVRVMLHSDPILLGTIATDAAGSGTLTFRVPNVDAGEHHIVATGESSGRVSTITFSVSAKATSVPQTPSAPGTIAGSGSGDPSLASTGTNSAASLWFSALLLVGLGVCASVSAGIRRSRRTH